MKELTVFLFFALAACSGNHPARAADVDAGASAEGTSQCNATGAGAPPDAALIYSPGPSPALVQQPGSWVATGAEGCDGLVPSRVPAARSWGTPGAYCFEGDPFVDGAGNLVFAYDESGQLPFSGYQDVF